MAQDARERPAPELTLDSAFSRLWRGFMTARVSVGAVLVLLLGGLYTMTPAVGIDEWLVALCVAYVAASLTVRVFGRARTPGHAFDPQWVSTIGVDLLAFSTLQFLQAGGINYSPLFALPVLLGAVLGSALLALGTAAGVTLLLLTDAWVQSLHVPADAASRFLQAGLTGTAYFALAFLVNQLAARLAREEQAARASQQAARVQAQVNALVIESLNDGVLVVDAQGLVHVANPAARLLLGLSRVGQTPHFDLHGHAEWQPLVNLARWTFEQRSSLRGEVAIEEERAGPRRIYVRTGLTSPLDDPGNLCVIFLEDLREMEARLRTEKLAAMGRMSAAVAHEFRNPLAAIAQANALMEEDLQDPAQQQLAALVRKNTQRLTQIVDEILDVSRVHHHGAAGAPALDLDASVAAVCDDWMRQTRSTERTGLAAGAPGARVPFEPDHLRRVLVNLLDNALRYAGELPDSIRVSTSSSGGTSALHVWSDGGPLEPAVEQHLFEPFFSSESRSSGLGLYICRELCERHGASLGYQRAAGGAPGSIRDGNDFFVAFAAPGPLAGSPAFDTMAAG